MPNIILSDKVVYRLNVCVWGVGGGVHIGKNLESSKYATYNGYLYVLGEEITIFFIFFYIFKVSTITMHYFYNQGKIFLSSLDTITSKYIMIAKNI